MSDLPLFLEPETPDDAEAIQHLNGRIFGPGRYARSAYRVRETADPDLSLSFVARVGTLMVGANAMTPIDIGGAPALLLGLAPSVVSPAAKSTIRREVWPTHRQSPSKRLLATLV